MYDIAGIGESIPKRRSVRLMSVLLPVLLLFVTACARIGPPAVQRDRLEYGMAVDISWREQMLLNLVKMRYSEAPSFVLVNQIVGGYTLERSISPKIGASGQFIPHQSTETGLRAEVSGQYKFTDRPTITYSPMTGERFSKGMLTPCEVGSLLHLIEAGWNAEILLKVGVQRINGINNISRTPALSRGGDPAFGKVTKLFRKLQQEGLLGLRVDAKKKPPECHMVFFKPKGIKPEGKAAIVALQEALDLDPQKSEINVAYGAFRTGNVELAIQTRSFLHMMAEYAAGVIVPPKEIAEGRVLHIGQFDDEDEHVFRVHSGKTKPEDCFVAVSHRGYWFWIEDTDAYSKHLFALLLLLQHMLESKETNYAPLVTIPAG
jgi:hypothetical protein